MGLYKRPGSSYWWFSFMHEGRRIQESTGVTDKKQARMLQTKRRGDYITGKALNRQTRLTLRKLLEAFLNDYSKVNKRSYGTDKIIVNTLLGFFGDAQVSQVTPQRIEQYKAARRKTIRGGKSISGSTVNRELAILKVAFNKGIEWDMVLENPVRRVKFFNEQDKSRTRYLSPSEKKRLLAACSPFLRRIVLMALKTGMRRGEILCLHWSDINPTAHTLTLHKTKSGRKRHIPIHPDIAEMLSSMPRKGEHIFCDKHGDELSRFGGLRSQFEAAMDQAGIRDFRFHDLRHTFASELVMKGADLKTVSELLGHSTTRMTERYSHLSPSHKMAAINLLGSERNVRTRTAPPVSQS